MKFEAKKKEIEKMERKKWSVGQEYQGEEKDGKSDGFGILFFVSGVDCGNRYEGEFRNGSINGKGIEYWTDDDWLEGEWKNNKLHGRVIYHYAGGKNYERVYVDGRRVENNK